MTSEPNSPTPEELRELIAYLERHVLLSDRGSPGIDFEIPTEGAMLEAGLDPDGVHRLLAAPWLSEMATEVRETPEFCEPGDAPEQILRYARDVVCEYIRKRFTL